MVIGVMWVIWWLNFEQFILPPPTYSLSCIVSTIIVIREFTEFLPWRLFLNSHQRSFAHFSLFFFILLFFPPFIFHFTPPHLLPPFFYLLYSLIRFFVHYCHISDTARWKWVRERERHSCRSFSSFFSHTWMNCYSIEIRHLEGVRAYYINSCNDSAVCF